MTNLERRDRRRADALLREASRATSSPLIHPDRLRDHIAAALKREREQTALRAVGYFFGSASAKRRASASEAILGEQKKVKR